MALAFFEYCSTRNIFWSSLIIAAANFGGSTAIAQDHYEQQVRSQLIDYSPTIENGGFRPVSEQVAWMRQVQYADHRLSLNANSAHLIFAVCDNDCTDIDLELFDESGHLIDEDWDRDDTPIVEVTPAWSGRFTLRVHMAHCGAENCAYGFRLFIN